MVSASGFAGHSVDGSVSLNVANPFVVGLPGDDLLRHGSEPRAGVLLRGRAGSTCSRRSWNVLAGDPLRLDVRARQRRVLLLVRVGHGAGAHERPHDAAGARPDDQVRGVEVDPGVLQGGEHPDLPRDAGDAAAAEDECSGSGRGRRDVGHGSCIPGRVDEPGT